jgi:TetR/AcrR family transcriptional regulator, tetracycline repressor protein
MSRSFGLEIQALPAQSQTMRSLSRKPRDRQLSRRKIVRATIQEIDDNGLASFSVRNVANRLGVYPTAIYWYIANRNLILAEVVAEILEDVAPKKRFGWQNYLRELFMRYRTSIKEHPNLAPLVGAHLIGNSSISLSLVESLLSKLSEAGFEGENLVGAYNTVVAALVGFVTQEFAPIPEQGSRTWQSRVKDRLLCVDVNTCPVLGKNLPLLANRAFILRWQNGVHAPLDDSFDRYIEVIIGGLERFTPQRASKRVRS